LKQNINTGTRY